MYFCIAPFLGLIIYLCTIYPFLGLVYRICQYTKFGLKGFSESLDGSNLSELPEPDLLLLFREVFLSFSILMPQEFSGSLD